ncbi:MAG: hypothetical protein K0Q70_590 [Rhodospirillales bacterium]|nr:hypothetical protein [Rhodospirillales bacterium]
MHKYGHVSNARMRRPAYNSQILAWDLIDVLDFRHEPATHRKLIGQRVTLVTLLVASIFIVCMLRP